MNENFIKIDLKKSVGLTLILSFVFLSLYPIIEPLVAGAIESTFTISQSVTGEISFQTSPSNVTMSPAIPGLTGGSATGQTSFTIITNNPTGYNVTLTSSSTDGSMVGNVNGGTIGPYTPDSFGIPDYDWSVGANSAEFGYNIEQETDADASQIFRYSGTSCNAGSTNDGTHCWLNATSSATTIVNRSSNTDAGGEQTTLNFKVEITSNPSPAVPIDTYVATTTITAVTNP